VTNVIVNLTYLCQNFCIFLSYSRFTLMLCKKIVFSYIPVISHSVSRAVICIIILVQPPIPRYKKWNKNATLFHPNSSIRVIVKYSSIFFCSSFIFICFCFYTFYILFWRKSKYKIYRIAFKNFEFLLIHSIFYRYQ